MTDATDWPKEWEEAVVRGLMGYHAAREKDGGVDYWHGYARAALTALAPFLRAENARLVEALDERDRLRAENAWQPIETAPRDKVDGGAPVILLASDSGHRALGYWGKGIRNTTETWISIHDHLPIEYWNALTRWMPAPEPPRALTGDKG